MISDRTIEEVKSKMNCAEVIGSFVTLKPEGSEMVACCPFHNERSPSFKVNLKDNFYKCFGCGKSGDAIQFLIDKERMSYTTAIEWLAAKYNISIEDDSIPKVYVRPVWKNNTTIPDSVATWFKTERNISPETLIKAKVTAGVEWMPQLKADAKTIQFNFFRGGELINVKYRTKDKHFKLAKDAELIFYNLDSLNGKKEVIITEGEVDAISLIEAGLDANYGIISVPNGANLNGTNLIYVDNCIDEFSKIEKIHIGVDNDTAGRKLRDQLAERFGKDICDYIEWKDLKDANDVLKRYGIQGILDCVAAKKEFPLEGSFTISDFNNEIEDLYINGLPSGDSTGIRGHNLRYVKGYITVITGAPGSGKSEFVDEITLNLCIRSGWKGAFYSPENKPTQLHFSKMAAKLVGKPWEGDNKMTLQEVSLVKNFLERKVWFIKPEKDFTLDSILEAVATLKKRHGLDYFVIDAWNKLEHKSKADTEYIGKCLDALAVFCEAHNLHLFLVAHPAKMQKDKKTGQYLPATLYDISGSANFYNKADNGLSVYRDFDTNVTTIYIQKVKFNHWGWVSQTDLKFNKKTYRYYEDGMEDFQNWITKQFNRSAQENVFEQQSEVIVDNDFDNSF